MSLAMVMHPPPGDNGLSEWSFAHSQHHLLVVQSIRTLTGIVLPTYVIDPIPKDFKGWAEKNQAFHNDANGILGTDGSDLQTVEWEDSEERESWMFLHFEEHLAWVKRLGGGI